MEIDARGSEKSLSFCYLKIDNIFCVSRLTREGSRVIIMTEANSSVKSRGLKFLPKFETKETDSLCVA